MSEDKLVVYTVIVRVPAEQDVSGWSVRAVETKQDYLDDIVEYSVFDLPPEPKGVEE